MKWVKVCGASYFCTEEPRICLPHEVRSRFIALLGESPSPKCGRAQARLSVVPSWRQLPPAQIKLPSGSFHDYRAKKKEEAPQPLREDRVAAARAEAQRAEAQRAQRRPVRAKR